MRVHLVRQQTIEIYIAKHSGSKAAFESWLALLKIANWDKPADMNRTYNSADLLGKSSSRVIFNIGGNNYRMICKYNFGKKKVHLFICYIGTHAEYDKLCEKGDQYTISLY